MTNDIKAKTLLYDIETSMRLVYVWAEYEQNVLKVVEESYILCFAYKWLGDKKTKVVALPDFKGYKKDKKNDFKLVKELHSLMDDADIIIGQNSDKFDNKWANKQFIKHNLNPVSPYRSIDTLKVARKHFRFDSNRLDSLGEFLGLGRKLSHEGLSLWFKVMEGDKKAWRKMIEYARQDVVLLEQVYNKLKPYQDTHPNLNQYNEDFEILRCPVCQSTDIHKRGFAMVGRFSKTQRYKCNNCGKWAQSSTQRIVGLTVS